MYSFDEVKEFSIAKLELTPRTQKTLQKAGIKKIGQVLSLSAEKIGKLPNADRLTALMTEVTLRHQGARWGVELSLAREPARRPRIQSEEEMKGRELRRLHTLPGSSPRTT